MNFLRAQFENELEPYVENGLIRIGRYTYTSSEILKLSGDESFKQAFGDWSREEWKPRRRDRRDEILRLASNQSRYDDLKTMVASGGATPFVGSGMSVPTGFPTWSAFLQTARKRTMGFSANELKQLLATGNFEEAASRIFDAMPPRLFNECFEGSFAMRLTRPVNGSVRLLPLLFNTIVITTNFDSVLEDVYRDSEQEFQDVLYGADISQFRKKVAIGSRCLLKLHGNYNNTSGRVLLKHEYDDFYSPNCEGREELTLVFKQGGLIFLGCSLVHDRTMELLKALSDSDRHMPRHYAFLKMPNARSIVSKEHFLAERNIFPIWYDGDHDTDIEALLVGILEDLNKV